MSRRKTPRTLRWRAGDEITVHGDYARVRLTDESEPDRDAYLDVYLEDIAYLIGHLRIRADIIEKSRKP